MSSDKIDIVVQQDTDAQPIELSVFQDETQIISAQVLVGYSSDLPSGIVERLERIESLIPSAATPDNQLADKEYVDTAIAGVDSTVSALAQNVAENTSDIAGIKAQQAADKNDIAQLQSDVATNTGTISALESEVDDIQAVIPSQASAENPLADKAFVNSTVQTSTANFRGNWPTYADIPSIPTAYPVDFAGSTTPTPNDYLVVEADENYDGQTWRYKYIGDWATQGKSGWRAEYKVNDTPLTAGQLAALNSGATAENIAQIATNKSEISTLSSTKADKSEIADMLTATDAAALYETQDAATSAHESINEKIDSKQDKLTAGENITIENNVISATGGGGGGLPDSPATNGTYALANIVGGEGIEWTTNVLYNFGGKNSNSITMAAGNNPYYKDAGSNSFAIGYDAQAVGDNSFAIGCLSNANADYAIGFGHEARASAKGAIQLNSGTNDTPNSFCVSTGQAVNGGVNYMLLKDGLIPSARLAADGTTGQVLSKTDDGMAWVDMGGGSASGLPDQAGHTGYLQTDGTTASWSDKQPLVNKGTANLSFGIGPSDTRSEATGQGAIAINGSATGVYAVALGGTVQASRAIGIGSTYMTAAATYSCFINTTGISTSFSIPNVLAFRNSKGENWVVIDADGHVPSDRLASGGTAGQGLVLTDSGMAWQDVGGVSYADLQQVQTELQSAIDTKADASAITDMLTKTDAAGIYQTQASATATNNAQDEKITANASAISALTGRVSENETNITTLTSDVGNVQELIPTQASDTNQLADKAFVNSTIQTATANFRGNWATHADIPSDVSSYPEDYAGNRTPTVNDYLVVEADETHDGATWRYKYTGNWADQGVSGWVAEYKVNDTPLTAAQLSAVNSGITAEYVSQIDTNRNDISEALGQIAALDTDKQGKLTAGTGIDISDENVVAVENPLPALAGNSGFLTTDGTTASWSGVAAATKTDISDMLTRTNAAQTYLTQADAKTTYVNTVLYEQTQNAVSALQVGKQDKLTAGDGINIENNVISATGSGLSVGMIFAWPRTDDAPGAVETNGARYNVSDFGNGQGTLSDLLARGVLPYVSLEEFENQVATNGYCIQFGYDGVNTIRVPKITWNTYQSLTIPVRGNGMTLGLDNGATLQGLVQGGSGLAQRTASYGANVGSSYGSANDTGAKTLGITTDSSKSGLVADIEASGGMATMRCMVQMFNATTDNALVSADEIAANVAKLNNMMTLVSGRFLVRKKEPTADDISAYEIYSDGFAVYRLSTPIATNVIVEYTLPFKMRDKNYFTQGTENDQTNTYVFVQPISETVFRARANTGTRISITVVGYADPSEYVADKWNVRPSANGMLWLPVAPSANGTYSLGLNMKDGTPTPFWGQSFVRPPSAPQRYLVRKKQATVADPVGYSIYSDGYMEYEELYTMSANNVAYKFRIPFRDAAYVMSLACSDQDTNASITSPAYVKGTQTATGFSLVSGYNGTFYNGTIVHIKATGYADPTEYTNDKWGDDTDYSQMAVMTGDPSPFKFKAWTNAGGETVYTLLAVPIARGDDMYTEDQLAVYNEWDANQSTAPLPKVEDRCGALGIVNGNRAINGGGVQMGEPGTLDAATAYVRNQALDTNG